MQTQQARTALPDLPDMIEVPGGSFLMGCETGRLDEQPLHRVRLRPFAVARLPVSNAEYARFVAAGQPPPRFWHDPRFNRPEQPVVGVRWEDAVAYCNWLTGAYGRRFRLPIEAEWEFAASAGDGRIYPWGEAVPQRGDGRSFAAGPLDQAQPLGEGPLNPLGIGDLCWNVHEWCSDWYGATYYAVSPEDDPQGPPAGTRRASRGGAWRHQIPISRCAARSAIPPALEYSDYGFRVFADPADPGATPQER